MEVVRGPTEQTYAYITTVGARHFVRRFMANRDDVREAGIFIDKHHIITWLGRDDGFAADLAMMAKTEFNEVVLSDPDNACLMPLSVVIVVPLINEWTLKEINAFRNRRATYTGSSNDVCVYAVASEFPLNAHGAVVSHINGPELSVHCEWSKATSGGN